MPNKTTKKLAHQNIFTILPKNNDVKKTLNNKNKKICSKTFL